MRLPRAIEKVIESFEKLPGIGPKTAQRLTFYLLHVPQSQLDEFAQNLSRLKQDVAMCSVCFNMGDVSPCRICQDEGRDRSVVCVVEDPLDVVAIEKSGKYNGLYHVLHGVIDPLNNVGPEEIYISQLLARVREDSAIHEVILATNPTLEGEATAMYIAKEIQRINQNGQPIRITRIGRGLPTGADLEYADEQTLARALEGRNEY